MVTYSTFYKCLVTTDHKNLLPTVIWEVITDYSYSTSALLYKPGSTSTFHSQLVQSYYNEALTWLNPVAVGSSSGSSSRVARFHDGVKELELRFGSGRLLDSPSERSWFLKKVLDLGDLVEWERVPVSDSQPSSEAPKLYAPVDTSCFAVGVARAFVDSVDLYIGKDVKWIIDEAYYNRVDSCLAHRIYDDWRYRHPIEVMIQLAYQSGREDWRQDLLLYWIRLCRRSLSGIPGSHLLWTIWCKTIVYALGNIRKYTDNADPAAIDYYCSLFQLLDVFVSDNMLLAVGS